METEYDVSIPVSGELSLCVLAENEEEARQWFYDNWDQLSDVIFGQVEEWITNAYERGEIKVE